MNKIIRNLTIQNYRNFKFSFENIKEIFWDEKENKLINPGEYGTYREDLAKKWLQMYVPKRFGIGSGFIINSSGLVSTQCDIIIYDKMTTPKIENINNQRFFPIETVSCVGEIKSDVNSIGDLNSYLIKLAEFKKMREGMKDPDPYYRGTFKSGFSPKENPFDNIFTFLICNKFNFNINPEKIDYGTIEQRFKHNVVLSLNDGILDYKTKKGTTGLAFPFRGEDFHLNNYLENDNDELPIPVISFLRSLQIALNFNALHLIDMTLYLTDKIIEKII